MIVFVFASDLEKSVAFYEALGFGPAVEISEGMRQLRLGATGVLLCTEKGQVPPASDRTQILLNMEPGENFEEYRETCRSRGLDVSEIIQESFGRIFWVRDPDGVSVQINAID